MDVGVRGPFVDLFRRGDVPREVRLLAARGGLGPPALEQLALLVWLSDDADTEVATAAAATIDAIPVQTLGAFLARSDVPDAMRAYFATRDVTPRPAAAPIEGDAPLIDTDDPLPDVALGEGEEGADAGGKPKVQLSQLAVTDRVKIAMKGTREQRSVLVRDANKLVSSAVIASPKLNDSEVEAYARMTNVSEEVLRLIGNNRSWMKNYSIAAALTKNPKTPVAISLRLVTRMNDRDMKALSRDRNVSEPVRRAAQRFVAKTRG